MVLQTILCTVGDATKVLHACDTREAAIDYIKTIAIKWACDNVGVNNFVDTLEVATLPSRAGFYIQYADKNTRVEIIASQVIVTPTRGYLGTYNEVTVKRMCRWSVVETDANIVLSERVDKLSREVEKIINEYRDAESDRAAIQSSLDAELTAANNTIAELRAQIHDLEATIEARDVQIAKLKVYKPYQLFTPIGPAAIPSPVSPVQTTTSYDDVVTELKNKLAEMPLRRAVSRPPPPPPPPPPSFYGRSDDPWTSASDTLPSLINAKSLDELLDELDDNTSFDKW